jgi:hypothetical protein
MLLEIFHEGWDGQHVMKERVSVTGMYPFTYWSQVTFKVRETEGGTNSGSTADNNKEEAGSAFSASREDM